MPPLGQFGVAALQKIAGAFAQGLGDVLVEGFDAHQVLEGHESDFLDRRKTLGHQQVGDDIVDIQRFDEQGAAGAEFLLTAFGFGLLGQNVDVPAGQLRGQAHILAAPADGKALLLVGDDDFDSAGVFVQDHLGHLGRRQGVHDKGRVVARPGDDIDLFALQFLDHGLDPAAAHADAGADRVDRTVVRNDGNLRPRSGVARHSPDLDNAVVDFRHFLGEQLGHELRMGARQENLRPAQLLAHIVDVGADAVALAEILARDQLVAPDDGFRAPQIHHDMAELDPFDDAMDHFAHAVLIFLVLAAAFSLSHLLDDDLLGGLRGNTAEFDRRQRIDDEIADFLARIDPGGVFGRDLRALVLDLLGDLAVARQQDFAIAAVDRGADIQLVPVFRAAGFLNGLLHRVQDFVPFDALFAGHGVGDLDQLRPVQCRCDVHRAIPSDFMS